MVNVRSALLVAFVLALGAPAAASQSLDELVIFGYFQNEFFQQSETLSDRLTQTESSRRSNSFVQQQLNLFFQKDLGQRRRWRARVNFEALNSFSSFRRTGSLNLEEAWVQYQASRQFNVKLGLQIPKFNHLNEDKNRTPLLPYIVRPLVYESSFGEFLDLDEFLPERAFVQVYGHFPRRLWKLDYAFYLGNSPNINSIIANENFVVPARTGVDTTDAVLFGFRLGGRYRAWKAGVSSTFDHINGLIGLQSILDSDPSALERVPRQRFGTDLLFDGRRFRMAAEWITVIYKDQLPNLELDRDFLYATVGYDVWDRAFIYGSYSYTYQRAIAESIFDEVVVYVPTAGLSVRVRDDIVLKAQYAYPIVRVETIDQNGIAEFDERSTANYYTLAVSVIF